jgi:mannose-1-phosphate guanylyltransferase
VIRQAVLLLGGRGTRLWPLTETRPKELLPLAGMPFVEYQLRLLVEAGVEQVLLAVGTRHQAAWRDFAERREGTPELQVVVEEEALDTAGQVVALARQDALDDSFLVMNGDVLFDARLAELLPDAPEEEGVLVLTRVDDTSTFGVVVLGGEDRIERFVEKPPIGLADTVSAGMYLLRREALAGFGPGPVSFEREVFPALAEDKQLKAVVTDGAWIDIGTPARYLAAHHLVLHGGSRLHRPAGPHRTGEGSVVAGEQRGTWSWIGGGAVVEEEAVVAEAVVMDGAHLHSGSRVERAVVGSNSQVLAGAVVRDLALVGEGCRIGPECELAAGVRVAPGARLGVRWITFSAPQ